MGRLPGENPPPVEEVPADYGVHPSDEDLGTPGPLNWRSLIEGAGLAGPVKMLATQAEVLELTHDRAELRLSVRAFATEANRKRLAEDISRYLGHPFHVAFEVGNVSEGATVAAEQRRERVAEHLALVEAFSKDPFVKSIVEIFHGTVDEGSVRAADGAELLPGSKRRTRR